MTDSYGGLCDRCVALQVLDLGMAASEAQIEGSYRTLVKIWHPDRFQADPKLRQAAEEKLKEINSAHAFLMSAPAQELPKNQAPLNPPPEAEPASQPVEIQASKHHEPEVGGFESAEVRRILKRRRRRFSSVPRLLLQAGVAVGAIAMLAILWLVIDAILMTNPRTAGPWEQYKAELGRDLHSTMLRMWGDATDNLHAKDETVPPVAAQPQLPATPSQAQPARNAGGTSPDGEPQHLRIDGSSRNAQPYVTSGLTPPEVLAILGTPTSSSGEKIFYKGSEIDFKNGRVAGWKVDPKSAPIRVKLWPAAAPAPGLTRFALGSSKSDVIALQGTPTLFSDNKFGYGNSVVFFQNDRVVSWHEDPNSVQLKVAH